LPFILRLEITMNIARFEPWTFVDLLRRDLDRLTDPRRVSGSDHESVADWVPAVDILESKDGFLLRADVPGVDPEDIRRAEPPADDVTAQRVERATGKFFRHFTLPETADAEGITAKCSNGILAVSIPKMPEVQARRITVEAT
jgi:HSP20 family protein